MGARVFVSIAYSHAVGRMSGMVMLMMLMMMMMMNTTRWLAPTNDVWVALNLIFAERMLYATILWTCKAVFLLLVSCSQSY